MAASTGIQATATWRSGRLRRIVRALRRSRRSGVRAGPAGIEAASEPHEASRAAEMTNETALAPSTMAAPEIATTAPAPACPIAVIAVSTAASVPFAESIRSSPTTAGTTASEIGRKIPAAAPATAASATTRAGEWMPARTANTAAHTRSANTSARRGWSRFSRSARRTPITTGGRNSAANTAETHAGCPVSWYVRTARAIAAAYVPSTLMAVARTNRRNSASRSGPRAASRVSPVRGIYQLYHGRWGRRPRTAPPSFGRVTSRRTPAGRRRSACRCRSRRPSPSSSPGWSPGRTCGRCRGCRPWG